MTANPQTLSLVEATTTMVATSNPTVSATPKIVGPDTFSPVSYALVDGVTVAVP